MIVDDLKEQYFKVFDKCTGDIKLCGRDECKKLMDICNKIYPDKTFGDTNTGHMDIDAIKSAAKTLNII